MKRQGGESGDYSRGFPKRQRGDQYNEALAAGKFELRFLVSTKNAGAVIGKGGDNIKRLRSQFDASVSVPDSQAPERVLTIVCDCENITPLCQDVLPKLDENAAENKKEARMLVHMSHAGAIIGKGGSKIKELRDETGCNIKVYSECAPHSSDRVVQITGTDTSLPNAVKTIVDLIKEIPIKGQTRQYDPITYDPAMVPEYGGYHPVGERGGRSRFPQMMPPRGGMGGMGAGGSMRGRDGGYGPPMGMGFDPSGAIGGYGFGAAPGGPPGGPASAPGAGGPTVTQQVTIPTELGGTIIGRGGERINNIRERSGAHIVLESTVPGQDERIITITGTQHQIQAAQYFLQQCVRNSFPQGTVMRGTGVAAGARGGFR